MSLKEIGSEYIWQFQRLDKNVDKLKPVITILTDIAELEEATDLQVSIWDIDYRDAIPAHLIKSIGNGVCTPIGAKICNKLIGFIYTFFTDSPSKQYLHAIGVHPDYRSLSIGWLMLKEQYSRSVIEGVDLIEWTYDPLEAPNAKLYISKVGGIVEGEYLRDNYGKQQGIYKGVPSDRFKVKWQISSAKVKSKLDIKHQSLTWTDIINLNIPFALQADRVDCFQKNEKLLLPNNSKVFVEIPISFQELKKSDMEKATKWRLITREIFESYFLSEYFVTDFYSVFTENGRRNFYLLEKSPNAQISNNSIFATC